MRHVCRNFSEYIIVVPGVNESYILAPVFKSAYYKIYSDYFAEVSNVYCSARSDSAGACIKRKVTFFFYYFYYAVVVDENAEGTMGQKLKNAGFECYPVFE